MNAAVVETWDGIRYYPPAREGEQRLVSVTSALGWVFRYGGWTGFKPGDPKILTARRRGTAVHKACEILALGRKLDDFSIHPRIRPYIEQFEDFRVSTGWRATAVELRVRSARFGYAGRLDQVGEWPPYGPVDGGLLDLKTTEDVWLAGYQVAAYDMAYKEMSGDARPRSRGTLILNGGKPGGWRLRKLSEASDFSAFMSALNCFKIAEYSGRLPRVCPRCGEAS